MPSHPSTGPCIVFPTISFRASDQVGNETVVGYDFVVDNIPPVADLDSLNVRDSCRRTATARTPSIRSALDRHLGDMPNDGVVVPQVFDLRARVEDDGNAPAGLKGLPIAGLDPDETNVYILDDTTQPLVVDIDGDGTCDAINPKLIPTTAAADPEQPGAQGAAGPRAEAGRARLTGGRRPRRTSLCDYRRRPPCRPSSSAAPGQPYTTMTYAHGRPAIWSVEPISRAWCMGSQFDTRANHIDEGLGLHRRQSLTWPATPASRRRSGSTSGTNGNGAGAAAPPAGARLPAAGATTTRPAR